MKIPIGLARTVVGTACVVMIALGSAAAAEAPGRVNINTASVAELTGLPGIGAAKAAAIVEHREREPFTSVDDLKKVKGIGDKMLEQLRDKISVGNEQEGSGGSRRRGS